MIDIAEQNLIKDIFRRTNRTFLQYASQSTPWYRDRDKPIVDKIQQLAAEEVEGAAKLARWMDSKGISLPYLGAFPSAFTNFNFVDVRKLLGPLIEEQRRELERLDKEGKLLTNADARREIEDLAKLSRKALSAMEEPNQSPSS